MLELVFVIVILGIVASIGSEIIVKVYESYIVQRAQHRATLKTELAATQIAKRLESAIPGTIVRRNALSGGVIEGINDDMSLDGDDYIALQWVSADTDSFNTYNDATQKVGWSGFCDINVSTKNSIVTPGSELSLANTIKGNLGSTSNFAIYFPYDTNTTAYFGSGTTDTITLDNNTSHIVEHYKLAWTSYALVVTDGDLYLHYNFSPELGVDIGNTKSLLMKNISTFKFMGAGRTIRFKICKQEPISEDVNITACKEKAVF
jgi:Tfp pilus assembly major pilin PilA